MRTARSTLVVATAMTIASCGFVGDHPISGPYRLVTVDADDDTSVCYTLSEGNCIGRVPATVFAIGFNSSYIVAARHPDNDRSRTEFYYIDRAVDGPLVDPSVSVKGPFNSEAFAAERSRLGLPEPK